MTLDDYLGLITSEHSQKPKFAASVAASLAPIVRAQELIKSLPEKFDIDTAVGDQLDRVGEWVGISRNVAIPMRFFQLDHDGVITGVSSVGGKSLFACVAHGLHEGDTVTIT